MKCRCRIAQPVVLVVALVGLAAAGARAEWHYYYYKEPQPLALDVERIAVQKAAQVSKVSAWEGLSKFGIGAADVQPHAVRGWSYARCPATVRAQVDLQDLVHAIAQRGDVGFVSPVFLDARGLPLLITRHLHVGFKHDIGAEEAEAILAEYGAGTILERDWSRMKGVYRLQAGSRNGFDVLGIANALAQHPAVRFAEPDLMATAEKTHIPNDTYFSSLWGIHNTGQSGGTADMDMDGPEAWDITTGDSSTLVVVMDTGIQLDHPDLNLGPGDDFTGEGGDGGPGNECDDHGTMVAGCISAIIDNSLGVVGIAPHCRVASARVFISNVPCSIYGQVSPSWVVDALDWAYEIGARVTTASIGMPSSGALNDKYEWTRSKGITHFTSSGNGGGGSIGYPGNLDAVNAIGALDDRGNRASFSQYGPDLAYSAPGVNIRTTARGSIYTWANGTSFASPYAAGVAALIVSAEPALTTSQVERVLAETAVDRGSAGWDSVFGWGFVNAHQGVEWLSPPASPCDLGKLTAVDAAADSQFGWAVAMDDDVLLVGAPRDDEIATDAGAVYVYRRSGTDWNYETKLTAWDAALEDRFGHAVAVDGDVAIIGAYLNDAAGSDAGAVYVFRWNGASWDQEQKLTASDADDGDRFGFSVAVSGNVALAGAYGNDDAGSNSGSAYVFRWNGSTWPQEQKLTASDAALLDFFGWSVSLSGDMAAVAAPLNDDAGSSSGSVYVVQYDGQDWDDQTKLTASDAEEGDNFGYSVAIDGNLLVVGAQLVDTLHANAGAAYFYRFTGSDWLEDQKIHASDGAEEDRFGYSVSTSAGVAVIGAYRDDDAGEDCGAAYTYTWNDFRGYWGREEKLVASDAAAGDQFGRAVAASRGFALVGAPYDADMGDDTGSAYLYGAGTDCNENQWADICDIRDTTSEDLDDNGVPDDCCPSASSPFSEEVVMPKNRYISFRPGAGDQIRAFRVTLVNLPEFPAFNGTHMWVDTPGEVSEVSGVSDDTPPTFWGANLACDPVYMDWSDVDLLHVYDREIVPNSEYAVQAIAEECDTATEHWYSSSVTMLTVDPWGDLVGNCGVTPCTPPDGTVDFVDISALVDKFKNALGAPINARADLAEDLPDAIIDFRDISRVVDAFRGDGYPFGGPQACPP